MTTATKTGVTMSILESDGKWCEVGDYHDAIDAVDAACAAQRLSGSSAKYSIHSHHWTRAGEPDKLITVDGQGHYTTE
jgi:hypothetical protein